MGWENISIRCSQKCSYEKISKYGFGTTISKEVCIQKLSLEVNHEMKFVVIGNYKAFPTEGMEVITRTLVDSLRKDHHANVRTVTTTDFIKQLPTLLFFRPDVFLFTHGPGKGVLILSRLIRFLFQSKIVWITSRPSLRGVSDFFLNNTAVDFIIGGRNTPEIEQIISKTNAIYRETVIGINLERLNLDADDHFHFDFKKKDGIPLLLHVGHIRKNRGLEHLVEIKSELGKNVDILVIGSPSLSFDEEVLDQLQEAGVSVVRKVIPNLSAIYRKADIYLFPVDPVIGGAVDLPLSILESLHCRTPVVSTPFGLTQKYLSGSKGIIFAESEDFVRAVITQLEKGFETKIPKLSSEFDLKNLANIVMKLNRPADILPFKKNKQILVSLIGTDGSGKTSTTELLFKRLQQEGEVVSQVWCGAESYLMWPFRFILKKFRKKKAIPVCSSVSYKSELKEKQSMSQKRPWLVPCYITLVLLDYRLQYIWKMRGNRDSNVLLLDRYYFDVAVNLAMTLGWSPDELILFLQQNSYRWRLPDVRVFVYVSSAVSMSRKDDIPDKDYVDLRIGYYRRIAEVFGFIEISGEANQDENVEIVHKLLEQARKKKRIHYVHCNNLDVGGADYCLNRMAIRINSDQNYACSVSLRLKTKVASDYEKSGIPVYLNNYCRPQLSKGIRPLLLFPFRALWDIIFFMKLFKVQQPDMVHVNDLYDFIPALAAKISGIPVVYHIRMIRKSVAEISFFSWFIRFSSVASFSVSNEVRNVYFGDRKISKTHNSYVVYDWPRDELVTISEDVIRTKPKEFESHDKNVLMVGRLEKWKGQHIFLDAVEKLREEFSDCGFFIVGGMVAGLGRKEYADEILLKAKELGVQYLGERSDIPSLMFHADISVHASTTPDPFPGVVLESMLSNSAVVAADAGGVSEMIRQNIDGIKYMPGNANQMAGAIRNFLLDEESRKKMASSARLRIIDIANKEKVASQIIKIYNKIIK